MFPLFATGVVVGVVVDTGGKFATGVNDTGGKFATGVNDASGKLPPVSTTPVANLPPVSTTPVVHLELRISPRISKTIRNGPNGIFSGLGKLIHVEVENLVALSL